MRENVLNAPLSIAAGASAFESFVETHRARAVRLAFRLLGGDAAAAEDVTQNAFLRAHRALAGFRGESTLDTWFYRILVREVQRYRRWQAVRRLWSSDVSDLSELADTSPQGDPALRRRIAAAMERLSHGQRGAFVLVHLEGFQVVEAATILGKAPGTVKSHLHRALASLRHDLDDLRQPADNNRSSPGGTS
jgi:RNA polymerase sigma-70 factor (ECF subfamily)